MMREKINNFCGKIKSAIKNHKFFALFIVLYCVILVAFSRYAPNVDDLPWFAYISHGEIDFFAYGGGNPRGGRFYPFAFIDLLILMQISKSPYLFFGANAILFALFSALYLKILNLSNGKRALNALITALLTTSIGFVTVFFGICYPEKIQVIWIAIFMLCTFFVIQKPTNANQLLGIIALNIALYYKEPTFIAAFAFGAVLLLYVSQNNRKDLQKYAFYIIGSALLYVILYILLVLVLNDIIRFYTKNAENTILREFFGALFNDSLIVFTCGGILLYRIYCVLIKKERIEPFFDGMLVASVAYFSAFVVLRMYAPYFILPCFVFGIPSILYFSRKYWQNTFIKICLILGLFGFLTQNLPSGIYKMIDLKAQGVQFHQTLDFVAQYLRENKSADIYFEGIGRGRDIYGEDAEFFVSWFEGYLRIFYDINATLRTDAPSGASAPFGYNVFVGTPKRGDLIIVSNKSAFWDSLTKAHKKGDLLYQSGFPSVPQIALMPLVKWLNVRYFKSEFFGKKTNFFATPLETYVFQAR